MPMKKITKGQCLCGSIQVRHRTPHASPPPLTQHKVTVDGYPLPAYPTLCCHCTSCKRRSGGTSSYAFLVPGSQVSIEDPSGVYKTFTDEDTASGKPMLRTMCGKCGSPVVIVEGNSPETSCLQYGLFADEVELPKPKMEFFAAKRCAWIPQVGEDVKETV